MKETINQSEVILTAQMLGIDENDETKMSEWKRVSRNQKYQSLNFWLSNSKIQIGHYLSSGEFNYDVGIYKEYGEYCILYHYEAEQINTDAIYICAR